MPTTLWLDLNESALDTVSEYVYTRGLHINIVIEQLFPRVNRYLVCVTCSERDRTILALMQQ
jgi:hypothetical protein